MLYINLQKNMLNFFDNYKSASKYNSQESYG